MGPITNAGILMSCVWSHPRLTWCTCVAGHACARRIFLSDKYTMGIPMPKKKKNYILGMCKMGYTLSSNYKFWRFPFYLGVPKNGHRTHFIFCPYWSQQNNWVSTLHGYGEIFIWYCFFDGHLACLTVGLVCLREDVPAAQIWLLLLVAFAAET